MSEYSNGQQERRLRAGAFALSLLTAPMNVAILATLAEGPKSLVELRRAAGTPPQTTMRKHLRGLADVGVVAKERSGGFPGSVDYVLLGPGKELTGVARAVEAWLATAPEGPIQLGTVAAKGVTKALVEGWSTTLLRALATRPLSLTELDALITGVSYPSLERRLVAMRMAGQVEAISAPGRGTPYAVTEWLRRAVSPLTTAACWERKHLPEETAAIGRLDVEATFLFVLPLLALDADVSGSCELRVETSRNGDQRAVGVLAGFEEGRLTHCRARLDGSAGARLSGSVATWFRAVGDGHSDELEIDGNRLLARSILDGLRATLGRPVRA